MKTILVLGAALVLYFLRNVFRILWVAVRTGRECRRREWPFSWRLESGVDLEDPLLLGMTIELGERRCAIRVFGSLSEPRHWTVRLAPSRLAGAVEHVLRLDEKDALSAARLEREQATCAPLGDDELDARFTLSASVPRFRRVEGASLATELALLRELYTRPELRAPLLAFHGSLVLEKTLSDEPIVELRKAYEDVQPALDWLASGVRLVEALELAFRSRGAYR